MEHRRDRMADRLSGAFWIFLGLVIVATSLNMDIREHLGATFLTGPGFVPILLGSALIILGTVLIVRSGSAGFEAFLETGPSLSQRRAMGALLLMLIYSLGLVGRIDFGLATFLFITTFIVLFNLPVGGRAALVKLAMKASVTAAVTSVVVVLAFRELFYIRLP